MKFCFFILSVCIFCIQYSKAQYIAVSRNYTAEELVRDILFDGSCAEIHNVQTSGGNFNDDDSWGYFSYSDSNFPLRNGIILTTGRLQNTVGPNLTLSDDGNNMNWGGDPDLNRALNISNSINATILEFDFVPSGNRISFDYLFASEEYHGTSPCNYSDGFAFLLKRSNSTSYQNLALIPNTDTPVKVTSVRPQIQGGCEARNEEYFDQFNPGNHPTNFNGQTKVLTAQAAVIPNETYHIKLVIADEGNYRYDSAIFLKGGSFSIGSTMEDNTIQICDNTSTTLSAPAGFSSYNWNTGENTSSVTISQAGRYTVTMTNANGCSATQNFIITASVRPKIQEITTTDFSNDNTAEISVANSGNFEFSINGAPFQDSPKFTGLPTGEHTAQVRDKNGCGTTKTSFYILDYPRFFTPNGDGYNDFWNIKNLDKKSWNNTKIYIFDRYGKLLKQVLPYQEGWDGTFNGYPLPSSDYWFILTNNDDIVTKGHFSLKR